MAANGGGGDVGHVRSKSDPSQLLPDHNPIRPQGFGVRRRSISIDSVYFYFGGFDDDGKMEAVKQFVTSTAEARRDRIDAVLSLWLPSSSSADDDGGHVRSKSDPQLLSDHMPIRPHGFSVLRRSISMDSVRFYFRGTGNDEVIDSVHQFVTRTADARRDLIDDILDFWLPSSSSSDDDNEDDAHDGNGDGDGDGSDDDDENDADDGNSDGVVQPAAPHDHGGGDLAAPAA